MTDPFGKSLLDITLEDVEALTKISRRMLALGAGVGIDMACQDSAHKLNLTEEQGIIYLCCTQCAFTQFLYEKDDPRTNPTAYTQELNEALFGADHAKEKMASGDTLQANADRLSSGGIGGTSDGGRPYSRGPKRTRFYM